MKANADVTEALRRTITTMQAELEKSVLSNQLLDSSTAALRATSSQHDTLTSAIETSKHLVTALEKADWLDRLLILSAFVFFLLVVLFILKQRFVDRGIRLMFWWMRFIPDFSGDAELLLQEEGKAKVAEVASSVAAVTASSVVGVVSSMVVGSSSQEPVLASPTSVAADPVETPSPSVTADGDSDDPISTVLSSIVSSTPSLVILPSSARTRPTEHVEL
jgi:protein transport protein SEC20